jgi:hypothetical protein
VGGNDGFGIFKDSLGETYPLKQTPAGYPKAIQHRSVGVDVFCSDQRDDLHGELIKKVRSLAAWGFIYFRVRFRPIQRNAICDNNLE